MKRSVALRLCVLGVLSVLGVALFTVVNRTPADAAPAATTNQLPGGGVSGVTVLCGPSAGYDCTTGGYAGQTEGWSGRRYGAAVSSRNDHGYHNCTLYVAWRLERAGLGDPGWNGNATAWDTLAYAKGIPVDQTPRAGSVAQWNQGYGHVAVVEVVTDSYIEVTDDNHTRNYTTRQRIHRGSPAWPDNFIHFPVSAIGRPVYSSFPPDGVRFTRSGQGQQYLAMRGAALPIGYSDAVALDAEGNRTVGIFDGPLPPAVLPNDTIIRPAGRQDQSIIVGGRRSPIRNTHTAACLIYSRHLPAGSAVVPPSWADSLPATDATLCSLPDHTRFTEPGSLQQYVSVRGAAIPVQYSDAVKYEAEGLRAFTEMPSGYVADSIHAPSRVPNDTLVRAVGTPHIYLYRNGTAHYVPTPTILDCLLRRYPQSGAVAVPASWLAGLPRGSNMTC